MSRTWITAGYLAGLWLAFLVVRAFVSWNIDFLLGWWTCLILCHRHPAFWLQQGEAA